MNLCRTTEKTINITSYGDWNFNLKKIMKEETLRFIEAIIE